VVVFAFLLSAGLAWVGSAFHRLQAVERWARRVTAAVVVAVGVAAPADLQRRARAVVQ
jgi:hypothetical protein